GLLRSVRGAGRPRPDLDVAAAPGRRRPHRLLSAGASASGLRPGPGRLVCRAFGFRRGGGAPRNVHLVTKRPVAEATSDEMAALASIWYTVARRPGRIVTKWTSPAPRYVAEAARRSGRGL